MNRRWVRRGLLAATLVGSLAFVSPGTAYAADDNSTTNNGLLNGRQADAAANIPITVCGNAVGIFGAANASCEGDATLIVPGGSGGDASATNNGLLNGSQADAAVNIPITVCGNAVGIFGAANASCEGDASVKPPSSHKPPHKPPHKPVHKPVHKPHKPKCHHHEKPVHHHMKPVHHHVKPASHHKARPVHEPPRLANTGADAKDLVPPALLMLLVGSALAVLGRRRKPAQAA